jgi:hypothetical protein
VTFFDTLVNLFVFSVYAIPIIIFVLGLIFYFKFPQFRLWIGAGLIVFGLFELIGYLQPIIVGMSRSYSYDIPFYWYIESFFQISTILLGVISLKNRIKENQGLYSY